MQKWTEKEIGLLKELYPNISNSQEEMCKQFGRNWEAIKGVAKRYKLKLLIASEYSPALSRAMPRL